MDEPRLLVASVTGRARDWIYELVRSYNRLGVQALGDLRRTNPGGTPKLNDVQQAQLLEALRGVAPDGGLWNGRKVADYLRETFDISVSRLPRVGISKADGIALLLSLVPSIKRWI